MALSVCIGDMGTEGLRVLFKTFISRYTQIAWFGDLNLAQRCTKYVRHVLPHSVCRSLDDHEQSETEYLMLIVVCLAARTVR
jgi:hypothetical protein